MLSEDGKVKVLDFGLAKAVGSEGVGDFSNSPTLLTAPPAGGNVLMGTAAYISPDQIRGRAADERSDVWAFGCVLYEMLTAKQAFTGKTMADLIGGIVRVDPDWNALPAGVTPEFRAVLQRCLEKDRRRRFHAIGDVRIALEEARSAPAAKTFQAPTGHARVAWSLAAVFAMLAVGALSWAIYFQPTPVQPRATRFPMEFPPQAVLGANPPEPYPSIAPDGRTVVFRALSGGTARLWLRSMDSLDAKVIAGTDGVGAYPFWSADSRFIGFFAAGKLKKVAVAGGPPQILCDAAPLSGGGGAWNQDDVILFENQGSINRVAASGGVSTPIRPPDKSKNETGSAWPAFLPDGVHFLYVAVSSEPGRTEMRVGALDSTDDKSLFPSNSRAVFANDHVLFVRDGTLMAQPFDARSVSLSGDAFPVAEGIASNPGNGSAAFSASIDGALVYRSGIAGTTELAWFDRSGRKVGVVPAAGTFLLPRLSPDQNHVALQRTDGTAGDIWLIDLVRGTNSRITSDPAVDTQPLFSPDGKQIVFSSLRNGTRGLYIKAATGVGPEEQIQSEVGSVAQPGDWSPDGKILLYQLQNAKGWDIWALPMAGERKPYPLLNEKWNEQKARFSPDGHWMSYLADQNGRYEVWVQKFPPTAEKWQVSLDGALYAFWRRDGKEIVFNTVEGKIMVVDVKLGASFEAGVPRELFALPSPVVGDKFASASDNQKFLIPLLPQNGDRPSLTAVLNWTADIKK